MHVGVHGRPTGRGAPPTGRGVTNSCTSGPGVRPKAPAPGGLGLGPGRPGAAEGPGVRMARPRGAGEGPARPRDTEGLGPAGRRRPRSSRVVKA